MAGWQTTSIQNNANKHDDFTTPKSAWESIRHLIPADKVIWEPFYCDGASGKFLTELGFQVIHQNIDFFQHDLGDIVVSNPPFSKTREVLKRLHDLGKPFILILPALKIHTHYLNDIFRDDPDPLKIIIPRRRIHYMKVVAGKPVEGWKPQTSYESLFYCWKIPLARGITFLS